MNYILGSSGLIGTAIVRELDNQDLKVVPRNEYENWINPAHFQSFLDKNQVNSGDTFYVCSGVTDPNSNQNLLQLHNCSIPIIVLKESIKNKFRVITFGSIQENFSVANNYVQSKKDFLKLSLEMGELPGHVHLQLHTIYGIHAPKNYMLLGKVLKAIRDNSNLKMSSGEQFREYWHATDVAKFVVSQDWIENTNKVVPISSGRPLRIKDLVTSIFIKYSLNGLLSLGSIPDDPNESYTLGMFNPSIAATYMRDPIRGVHEYIDNCLTETFNEG
jgi:nucleoside-diphosphate-sugar epimerase